ncbi:hypothetical protein [Allorhizocola rhizosphaerae]|uniref:hypothetical protein n=1 Tax=Allorhizocola rhizosphaerae TaxID=1872709 RepID=UPI000E3C6E5A|nr:hypothetical protein [Allorhizocola rhizosphaerae]
MSERTSIDDLFNSDPDPDAPRGPGPGRPRYIRWLSLLATSSVLAVLAFVGLRMAELTAPLPFLFAASMAVIAVWRMGAALRPPLASRQAGRYHADKTSAPDGVAQAIARWDTMMDWSHTDAARFNRKVLPRIAEVVDERLRQRHGITRAGDPQRARAILGDPLWTFVTTPSRRPPQPRELDQIVTALEKL